MSVSNIPVFLNLSTQVKDPIGFGKIEDQQLIITVQNELVVASIEQLLHVEQIKELYLGVGFPISAYGFERQRP